MVTRTPVAICMLYMHACSPAYQTCEMLLRTGGLDADSLGSCKKWNLCSGAASPTAALPASTVQVAVFHNAG